MILNWAKFFFEDDHNEVLLQNLAVCFQRWAEPSLFFIYFRLFVQKILVASMIRTVIIEVEYEASDH